MYSSTHSFTVSCATGATGPTATVSATATSIITQADANEKALRLSRAKAFEALQCFFINTTVPPTLYWNTVQSYTDHTFPPFNPEDFTETVGAGTIYSLVSVAEANATALATAQRLASRRKFLEQRILFHSTAQSYTARCQPPYQGVALTAQVSMDAFTSTISQTHADQLALALATANAIQSLSCENLFRSAAKSYRATCPGNASGVGLPVTVVNPEGAFVSNVSQQTADDAAQADAMARAIGGLTCVAGAYNTSQTFTASCTSRGPNWSGSNNVVTVPSGTYSGPDLATANATALGAATTAAYSGLVCHWDGAGGPSNP